MKNKAFEEHLYRKFSINDLIIFSLYSLEERKNKCNFEELVKGCFVLFPAAFSFSNFSKWPDARKLDRPLRSLRNKKLIAGDPKTTFSLTKAGRKKAGEIAKDFRQGRLKL